MSTNNVISEIDFLTKQLLTVQNQVKLFADESKEESQEVFDMNSWLSRRNADYAKIRDVRGASILLSRSILQFLIPEKGVILNDRNEAVRGIAHSKCNKDIRIGVTTACKDFGMKITGRGSIAGCESSNLIDIPIICDVLQSIGLFEDSSFPHPSDRVDKAERAERKAAKRAAALQITSEAKESAPEISSENTIDSSSRTGDVKSSTHMSSTKGVVDSNSIDVDEKKDRKDLLKYCPNLIDIEAVLTRRWDHQLQEYLTDMHKRKTPFHYHAADGISSEGVAMVASYAPTPLSSSRPSLKVAPKLPKVTLNTTTTTSDEEDDVEDGDIEGLSGSNGHGQGHSRSGSDVGDAVDYLDGSTGRKRTLSVLTDADDSESALDKATKKRMVRKAPFSPVSSSMTSTVTSTATSISTSTAVMLSPPTRPSSLRSLNSFKKNKAIRAAKIMIKSVVPFELSATPRHTPLSAPSNAPGRRPLDRFRESNGAGEQLNLQDGVTDAARGVKRLVGAVKSKSGTPSAVAATTPTTAAGAAAKVSGDGDAEMGDGCTKNNFSSDDSISNNDNSISSNGGSDCNPKDKSTKAPRERKDKDKDKKDKRVKLKDLDTALDGCDTAASVSVASSCSSTTTTTTSKKTTKRKDLHVVITPAAGGVVASAPVLPPRIGSGGVGGTTTGYSIAHALLKPSLSKLHGGGVLSEQLSGAQEMFLDPAGALQAWSWACYEEGLLLAEEERLIRQVAGLCDLSLPTPAFRIGTRYLDPEYRYFDEIARTKELSAAMDEKEEEEAMLRDGFLASRGLVREYVEDVRVPTKRRKASGGGGGGGHQRRYERQTHERHYERHQHEAEIPYISERPMLHSAVLLESPDGVEYVDPVDGEEYERVTDANVALTASMLWARAMANAVHMSSSGSYTETDRRPRREKKDFFDTYLSEGGGQSIAAAATATLASVAGVTNILQSDDDLSKVVLDQVDKIKKGSRNSAVTITSLHPGALQALDVHGIMSGPVAVLSAASLPLGGPVKRQRSLSNIQQLQAATLPDSRSTYLADTVGGYPTKNTVPPLDLPPSQYAPIVRATSAHHHSSKSHDKQGAVPEEDQEENGNVVPSSIHTCPYTGRISLQGLTVYSVKMPWKLLAREFEIFDPSAMEKDAHSSSYPRTPTAQPPTSPRYPSSATASASASAPSVDPTETTSNLNGPMGIWVPTTTATATASDTSANVGILAAGLRITAPQAGAHQIRRRRKRNSEGVLMEIGNVGHEQGITLSSSAVKPSVSATKPSVGAKPSFDAVGGPREFRRIAFADVLAPSYRLIDDGSGDAQSGDVSDDEEDISDDAILQRHEATLTSMRDRWKAIQELKNSLKKSTGGDDAGPGATGGYHATSNISHAHNKRRKYGGRPPASKNKVHVSTTAVATITPNVTTSSPKAPKHIIVDKSRGVSGVTRLGGKSPRTSVCEDATTPVYRKRGRPTKLSE